MAFWEEIGDTIVATGKEVANKAKNMTDIASLKGQIVTCENIINKNYKDIGRAYYAAHKQDQNPEFAEQIEAIAKAEQTIMELKRKIDDLKCKKTCSQCGSSVADDSVYCPKCGSKMEDDYLDEEDIVPTDSSDGIREEDIID